MGQVIHRPPDEQLFAQLVNEYLVDPAPLAFLAGLPMNRHFHFQKGGVVPGRIELDVDELHDAEVERGQPDLGLQVHTVIIFMALAFGDSLLDGEPRRLRQRSSVHSRYGDEP